MLWDVRQGHTAGVQSCKCRWEALLWLKVEMWCVLKSQNKKNNIFYIHLVLSSYADSCLKFLRYPPPRHLASPQQNGDYCYFWEVKTLFDFPETMSAFIPGKFTENSQLGVSQYIGDDYFKKEYWYHVPMFGAPQSTFHPPPLYAL